MSLDVNGLRPLDTSGLTEVDTSAPIDTNGLKPLDAGGLREVAPDAPAAESSEFTKGLKTGVAGAKVMSAAAATIPIGGAYKTLVGEIEVYDKIDAGEPVETKGLTFLTGRARMYEAASPEDRAKMRSLAESRILDNREVRQTVLDAWKRYGEEVEASQGRTVNFTDIWDAENKTSAFGDWFAFNTGQAVPYLGASTLAGLLGFAAGGPGGALAGVAGSGYAMGVGDIQSSLMEKGIEDRGDVAMAAAVPYAALDFLGPVGRSFRMLSRPALEQAASTYFKRLGREIPANAVEEFVNEAGQEIVKDAAVTSQTGEKLVTEESLKNWFNAGMAGAAAGGPGGAVSAGVPSLPGKTQPKERVEPTLGQTPRVDPTLVAEEMANLTPADRDSPIPDDLIAEGRAVIRQGGPLPAPATESAEASGPARDLPATGDLTAEDYAAFGRFEAAVQDAIDMATEAGDSALGLARLRTELASMERPGGAALAEQKAEQAAILREAIKRFTALAPAESTEAATGERIKEAAGQGMALPFPTYEAFLASAREAASPEEIAETTGIANAASFHRIRGQEILRFVEEPVREALDRVYEKGGQPFSSNAYGPGKKGVTYIDQAGRQAFEPMQPAPAEAESVRQDAQETPVKPESQTEFGQAETEFGQTGTPLDTAGLTPVDQPRPAPAQDTERAYAEMAVDSVDRAQQLTPAQRRLAINLTRSGMGSDEAVKAVMAAAAIRSAAAEHGISLTEDESAEAAGLVARGAEPMEAIVSVVERTARDGLVDGAEITVPETSDDDEADVGAGAAGDGAPAAAQIPDAGSDLRAAAGAPAPGGQPGGAEPAAPVQAGPVDEAARQINRSAAARKAVETRKAKAGPLDLFQFIAATGGIRSTDPNISDIHTVLGRKQRLVPLYGALIRKNGQPLDRIREAAEEAGYIGAGKEGEYQTTDLSTLLDAIDRQARGAKVYSLKDVEEAQAVERRQGDAIEADREAEALAGVKAAAAEQGINLSDEDARDAAALIRQGADEVDAIAEAAENAMRRGLAEPTDQAQIQGSPEVTSGPETDIGREVGPGEAPSQEGAAGERPEEAPGALPAREERRGDQSPGGDRQGQTRQVQLSDLADGAAPKVEKTDVGDQLVIPGAERISDKQLAERRMEGPARAKVAQKAADEGLFDVGGRSQRDLLDATGLKPAEKPLFAAETGAPDLVDIAGARKEGDSHSDRLKAIKERITVFASGMSRPGDMTAGAYAWGRMDTRGIGVEATELSDNALKLLAERIANIHVRAFVDSGAFNRFRRSLKTGESPVQDFDDVMARYERLTEAISEANEAVEDLPLPMFVMPDIVGDQAGTIKLLRKYAKEIHLYTQFRVARPVVALQVGDLSLAEMYRQAIEIIGSDDFIVGIPSNEKAVTAAQLRDLLQTLRPKAIHFLGAAQEKTLAPKLDVVAEVAPDIEISADANILRSALYGREKEGDTASRPEKVVRELSRRGGAERERQIYGDRPEKPAEQPAAAAGTYTLDEHGTLAKRIVKGDMTADELKANFRRLLASADAVKAELGAKTLKELAPGGTGGKKKADVVNAIYDNMLRRYHLGEAFTWSPFTEKYEAAITRVVEAQTDDDIKRAAQKRQEKREAIAADITALLRLIGRSDDEIQSMTADERRTALVQAAEAAKGVAVIDGPAQPKPGVTVYYVSTGETSAMHTLRSVRMVPVHPTGYRLVDDYIGNLAVGREEAVRKAQMFAAANDAKQVFFGAPEELRTIDRSQQKSQGGATARPLEDQSGTGSGESPLPPLNPKAAEPAVAPVEPVAAEGDNSPKAIVERAGLFIEEKTSKRGKTYWAVHGKTLDHSALLDNLGFNSPFRMGRTWYRSVFDRDPTQRLADALAGNPAAEPIAERVYATIERTQAVKILKSLKLTLTPEGDGFRLGGKTYEVRSIIKDLGGTWYGTSKTWRFNDDPTERLGAALDAYEQEARAGRNAAGDAGASVDPAEEERLRGIREREDARGDERITGADVGRYVSPETKDLIAKGLKFGIPEEVVRDQVEDVAHIAHAYTANKPMFLLANEAGTGKAQPLDANLLTPSGWKRMGDVRFGDEVIAGDGSVTRVVGVYPQGEKDIYRVTFSDGYSAECCDEHLWLTHTVQSRCHRGAAPWTPASQPKVRQLREIRNTLTLRGKKNHSIPMAGAAAFATRPVAISPYVMGVILGDGCTRAGSVTFTTADNELAEMVAAELDGSLVLRRVAARGCPTYAIRMSTPGYGNTIRNAARKAFRTYGVDGLLAHEKFVPDDFKWNAMPVRLAVLQGLMDTDGWVEQEGKSTYYCSTSRRLADDVVFIVQSLGGVAKIGEKHPKGGRLAYNVRITLPPEINPFRLRRKADAVRPKTKYRPTRYITAVDLVGRKQAQCIAVAHPSKLYVTDAFIVTHNTFVLGGAIRELRAAGATKFRYFTQSQDLIAQIKRDLDAYGVGDVDFHTYAELSTGGKIDADGAVLLFDEAHNVKNVADGTARAALGQTLIGQAKFSIFASATPFQNPVEARYLEASGLFKPAGGFEEWAKAYGAAVKRRKFFNPHTRREEVEEIIYWPGRGKKADGAAARQWFFKQGVMTQRPMKIDPKMVDVQFRRSKVDDKWVEIYDHIQSAYDAAINSYLDSDGNSRDSKVTAEISRHRENAIKRVLEASKVAFAIERAKELLADGKNVVIFVETKSDRELGRWRRSAHFKDDTLYSFDEMQVMMSDWELEAEAARREHTKPPPRPFAEFIFELARHFDEHGIHYELPSTADEIVKALGAKEVGIYTGAVTTSAATKAKTEFLAGKKHVLVATMAKGGTGLSLHDTVGNRPTVQLNINLPWAAWQVDQVAARVARYGLKSNALVEWMFASNIPWESGKLAPRVGARMSDMGAIVKGIEVKAAEKLLGGFDFEGVYDVKQAVDEGIIDLDSLPEGPDFGDDLYAQAERLERTRLKASDTSGGFFATPYPLAVLMQRISGVREGDRVLEPSAGHGALVRFMPEGAKITAVEQRADNFETLQKLIGERPNKPDLHRGDFLEWATAERDGKFDIVVMNPPFERAAGIGSQDVAHVRRAYDLLAPGGRLVAIMGEGPFFRQMKGDSDFRTWLDEVGATVVRLPEGAFKKSGTMVRARLVVIDRDRPGARSDLNLQDTSAENLKSVEAVVPARVADEGPEVKYAAAWHGTPHDFDTFDISRVGTGEGAQAYGWGLYFAGKKGVAEFYRDKLSDQRGVPSYKGKTIISRHSGRPMLINDDWKQELKEVLEFAVDNNLTLSKAAAEISRQVEELGFWRRLFTGASGIEKFAKWLESSGAQIGNATPGRLFKVELQPAESDYLYWDKPFSQQSKKVQAALKGMPELKKLLGASVKKTAEGWQIMYQGEPVGVPYGREIDAQKRIEAGFHVDGSRIRGHLGSEVYFELMDGWDTENSRPYSKTRQEASLALKAAGIPGIKYLDAGSRNKPLKDIKRQFLDALPQDADADEVIDLIGKKQFTAQQEAVLKALQADDWLGFDYPAQAISAAYLPDAAARWDMSPELVSAIEESRDDGTYNYVIFDDSLVTVADKFATEKPFFSALTRGVEGASQTKSPAPQWRAFITNLRNRGVKEEEIQWSGVLEWLADRRGPVTRDEIVEFLRANEIQIKEVEKSGPAEWSFSLGDIKEEEPSEEFFDEEAELHLDRAKEEIAAEQNIEIADVDEGEARERAIALARASYYEDSDRPTYREATITVNGVGYDYVVNEDQAAHGGIEIWPKDGNGEAIYSGKALDEAQIQRTIATDIEKRLGLDLDGGTQYEKWTLPGGKNYRELLLTIPKRPSGFDPSKVEIKRHLQSATQGGTSIWYDGKKVIQYDDPPALVADGRYSQKPDSYWLDMARQLYERGDRINDIRKRDVSNFSSSHFSEPNILAHIRFNERTDEKGKKVLFIEEIQSDWHQQGRRYGYLGHWQARLADDGYKIEPFKDRMTGSEVYRVVNSDGVQVGQGTTIERAAENAGQFVYGVKLQAVPDAPFKSNWQELAFKRAVRWAAENGFEQIAWTTGEQQANRYDLSKQASSIEALRNDDGTYSLIAMPTFGGRSISMGRSIEDGKLADYVGKDLADKIRQQGQGEHTYTGLDLKVGGEGMIGFYDKILPAFANKYGKKWGAKVGTTVLPGAQRYVVTRRADDLWLVEDKAERSSTLPADSVVSRETTEAAAREHADKLNEEDGGAGRFHSLDVTTAMRESVMQGQPLFSAAGASSSARVTPDQVHQALRKELDRVGLKGVDLKISEAILDRAGARTPHRGIYRQSRKLIEIAMKGDVRWTLDHEAIHALKDAGLFRKTEWAALERAAKADAVRMATIRDRYADMKLTEPQLVEEAIADMYADWQLGKSETKGFVRTAFERIRSFFAAIRNALTGLGFQSADDVFATIDRGDLGSRTTEPAAEQAAETFAAAPAIKSDAFKRWFGGSKVVDENGEPLVVYHASEHQIDAFDRSKSVDGFFFADDKVIAAKIAGGRGVTQGTVHSVYLSVQNPLVVKMHPSEWSIPSAERKHIQEAGRAGNDGVIFEHGRTGQRFFVAFKPEQIKSVENRGAFDPADERISYAAAPLDEEPSGEAMTMLERARRAIGANGGQPIDLDAQVVPLPFQKDLTAFTKYVVHPRTIATMFPSFTPVWNAGVLQFARRDQIASELIELKKPYDNLSRTSKAKVNKVLEMGRLQAETYQPDSNGRIFAHNKAGALEHHPGGAALTAFQEVVRLEPWEAHAYMAVRRTMDRALDLFRDQIVSEFGFDPKNPDSPTTAEAAAEAADKLFKAGENREAEHYSRLAKVLKEIEQAKRHGYVPFTRYGQWSVVVKSSDGDVVHREHFEFPVAAQQTPLVSKIARKRAARAIAGEVERLRALYPTHKGYTVGSVEQITPKLVEEIPSMVDIDQLLSASGLDLATQRAVEDAVAQVIQRQGFRKHFIASRNISGYSTDFERSLADYVVGISGYLARRETRPLFDEAISGIPAKQNKLRSYADRWHDYIEEPSEEFSRLRQLGFFYYLAGRVSSAMVNLSQVPVIAAPYLAQFANPGVVSYEISRAYKAVLAMSPLPFWRGLSPTQKSLAVFDPQKAPEDVRADLVAAFKSGKLVPLETFQEMGRAHSRTPKGREVQRAVNSVQDVAALAFTAAERLNRIVTFIAAHRLARRDGVLRKAESVLRDNEVWAQNEDHSPASFGTFVVDETQYVMGKLNRPTLMRGFGTLALQFKGYSLNTLELLWRMYFQHHGAAGKTALAYMAIVMFLAGGLFALPGAEDWKDLIESITKGITGKDVDLELEFRRLLGGGIPGRMAARGPLREGTGIDLSRRVGLGNVFPDPGFGSGTLDKLAPFGGVPVDLAIVRPLQTFEALGRGDPLSAAIRATPEAFADLLRMEQWRRRGVVARSTGRKVIDRDAELPDGSKLADTTNLLKRALGFQPTGVSRAMEGYSAVERDKRSIDEYRNRLFTEYAAAYVQADRSTDQQVKARLNAEMEKLEAEVEKHNEKASATHQIQMFRTDRNGRRVFASGLQQAINREEEGAVALQERKTPKRKRGTAEEIRSNY